MKKILFLIMALALALGPNRALASDLYKENRQMKVQYLIDNGLVEGRTTDIEGEVDYALDKTITRAETSKMLVLLLDLKDLAQTLKGTSQVFNDVKYDHWANGFISTITTRDKKIAYGRRIIVGYPDGNFYPEKDISYEELATMLVRIVKEDLDENIEDGANWAASYIAWAYDLGLLEDIRIEDSKKAINREEAFTMVFNALDLLGKTKDNKVDFKDQIGIVSKLFFDSLELNQEKTYTINQNTVFSNGTSILDLYKNLDKVGSLVRLIKDKDGNIEKILELGNNENLAIEENWLDIAKKVVSAKEDSYFTDNYTGTYEIKVGDVLAEIDEDTLLFAADLDNNILGPIKDPGQVFNHYVKDRQQLKNVYMGYDPYRGYNKAKVIVFGSVEIFQGKEELRRVITPVSSNLTFSAQSMIGGLTKVFSMKKAPVFPGGYDFNYFDVILMNFDSYEEANVLKNPKKLIDYSEDNVYKVVELSDRDLIIADQRGYEFPLTTREMAAFTREDLKVGSHVQVLFMPPQFIVDLVGQEALMEMDVDNIDFGKIIANIDPGKLIEALGKIYSIGDLAFEAKAISVVEDDLRGDLPLGFRTGKYHGFVANLVDSSVIIGEKSGDRLANQKAYRLFETEKEELLKAYQGGYEIVYDVDYVYGNSPYITNVERYIDYRSLGKLSNEELIELLLTIVKPEDIINSELIDLIDNSSLDFQTKERIKALLAYLLSQQQQYINNPLYFLEI